MSSFVSSTSTATAAALGRFHSGNSSSSNITSSTSTGSTTRQRSSSFTSQIVHANAAKRSSSPALATSRKFSITPETLNKGLFQDEGNSSYIPQRDLSLSSSSFSSLESATALGRAHDRINLVPGSDNLHAHNNSNNHHTQGYVPPTSPIDLNNDRPNPESAPTICTGRSRSNTLTNTSTDAVDVAAAAISTQFDHVMRPRRPSLVSRVTVPMTLSVPSTVSTGGHPIGMTSRPSHYPPELPLPQHHESSLEMNNSSSSSSNDVSDSKSSNLATTAAEMPQMGFLPRILVLAGLFGMSLGGLYLLAQVLPPLSLPKSIDDVKVDADILQQFATATFEGWLRTFWVFSAVYIWKQCFGIPGSAFLNILAGALYGPWFGTVLTSLLTTLGSVLAYFMSFFLMEPIMNRYASSKLDQMRAQIQKKTMRSSSSSSGKRSTGEVMQASSSATSISTTSILTERPGLRLTAPGGTLRTRSSSFAVRRTDETDHQDALPTYSYPMTQQDEIEVQENEGLLDETEAGFSHLDSQGQHQPLQQQDAEEEDDEEDEEEEGTSLFMQLLLIRLFPLTPYWFINLASPLVGVPVIPFMTSMFLGCMPYNYICAQAGAILGEIHELRDIYQQPWIMFQIVLVLILSFGGIWVSKRSKKQQLEKDQQRKNRKSRTSEEEEADDETTHSLLRPSTVIFDHGEADREEDRDRVEMMELSHAHLVAPSPKNKKRESAIIDMTAYSY